MPFFQAVAAVVLAILATLLTVNTLEAVNGEAWPGAAFLAALALAASMGCVYVLAL